MSDPISYALQGGVFYLRLTGELRHVLCGALDNLVERLFDAEPLLLRAAVIDLTQATFMDSTMIGLLAGIARELEAHDLPPATVFSTHPEINQLLRCLCLDQVFTVVEHPTDRVMDQNMVAAVLPPDAGPSEQATAVIILKAHEALIGINEANRPIFQSVVELFREQLDCSKR